MPTCGRVTHVRQTLTSIYITVLCCCHSSCLLSIQFNFYSFLNYSVCNCDVHVHVLSLDSVDRYLTYLVQV